MIQNSRDFGPLRGGQIIAFALKQAETGTPVAEVIRQMGICEQTF
jgi:hypothetical protein